MLSTNNVFDNIISQEVVFLSQDFQAPTSEKKPEHVQPTVEYDTYDDFERIYMRRPLEISLRMSVGAKKQGTYKKRFF